MTDQQLATFLAPLVLVVPPTVGFLVGIRWNGPLRGVLAAFAACIVTGLVCGVIWAVAVDLWASGSTRGGNPWIGHVQGLDWIEICLGGGFGGAVGTLSGLLCGVVVWFVNRSRKNYDP